MGLLLPTTKRTGKVFFDTLLAALEGIGAEKIKHDGKPGQAGAVIRCTYQKRLYVMHYSPLPAPRRVTTVIDVFRHIGLMPKPAKQQNIRNMSEQSYNKAKVKRGKKRHAA